MLLAVLVPARQWCCVQRVHGGFNNHQRAACRVCVSCFCLQQLAAALHHVQKLPNSVCATVCYSVDQGVLCTGVSSVQGPKSGGLLIRSCVFCALSHLCDMFV